ncbi:hypothetical protein F5051DRAFT_446035 [Lentinula edodes]|nr:hypothetical protein F5051DRAFT_446035 [Lentinula edodes]
MGVSPTVSRTTKRRRSQESPDDPECPKVRLVAISTAVAKLPRRNENKRKVEEAIDNITQTLNRWKSAGPEDSTISEDAHPNESLFAFLQCLKCDFEALWKDYEQIHGELLHTKETLDRTLDENTFLALSKDARERRNLKLEDDTNNLNEENRDLHLDRVKASKTEKSLIGTISCLNTHITTESIRVKNLVNELEKCKSITNRDVRIKQQLTHDIETLKQEVQNLSIDKHNLRNAVKSHKAKIETLNTQIVVLADQKSMYQKKNRALEHASKKDEDTKKELETALRISGLELEKAVKINEATSRAENAKKLRMDSHHAKQKLEIEELKEVRIKNIQLESSITSLKANFTKADDSHRATKANLMTIQHQNQELRTRVEVAETLHAKGLDQLRKREIELLTSIEALTKQKDDVELSRYAKAMESIDPELAQAREEMGKRERLADDRARELEQDKIELEAALRVRSQEFQNAVVRMAEFESWKNLEVEVIQRAKLGTENSLIHNLEEMKAANNALRISLQTVEWASSKALEVNCQETEKLRQEQNEIEIAFGMKNKQLSQIQEEQTELAMMIQSLHIQDQTRQVVLDATLQELNSSREEVKEFCLNRLQVGEHTNNDSHHGEQCLGLGTPHSSYSSSIYQNEQDCSDHKGDFVKQELNKLELGDGVKDKEMETTTSREENVAPEQTFGNEHLDDSETRFDLAQNKQSLKNLAKEPKHDCDPGITPLESPRDKLDLAPQKAGLDMVQDGELSSGRPFAEVMCETKYGAENGGQENKDLIPVNSNLNNTQNADLSTVIETTFFTLSAGETLGSETVPNDLEAHFEVPVVFQCDAGSHTGPEASQSVPDAINGGLFNESSVQYPVNMAQNTSSKEVRGDKVKASSEDVAVAEQLFALLVLTDPEKQNEEKSNLKEPMKSLHTQQDVQEVPLHIKGFDEVPKEKQPIQGPAKNESSENLLSSNEEKATQEQLLETKRLTSTSAENRLEDKDTELQMMREEKAVVEQSLETNILALKAIEERYEAKCTQLVAVEQEMSISRETMEKLRIQTENHRTTLNTTKQELDEIRSRHSDLELLFRTAQNDSSNKLRVMNRELERLREEKATAQQLLEAKVFEFEAKCHNAIVVEEELEALNKIMNHRRIEEEDQKFALRSAKEQLEEAKSKCLNLQSLLQTAHDANSEDLQVNHSPSYHSLLLDDFQNKLAEIRTIREEKAAVEQSFEAKTLALRAVEQKLKAKCSELGAVEQEKSALKVSMEKSQIETENQKTTLNTTKQELDELRSRHSDLQLLFGTRQNDNSKKLRDFKVKDIELQMLSEAKAVAEQLLEVKIISLDAVDKKLEAKCHDLRVVEQELATSNGTIDDSSKKLRVKDIELQRLSEAKAAAEQLLEAKIISSDAVEKELEAKCRDLRMVEQELATSNGTINNLQTEIEVHQVTLSNTKRELDELQSKHLELRSVLETRTKLAQASLGFLNKYDLKVDAIQSSLSESEDLFKVCRKSLETHVRDQVTQIEMLEASAREKDARYTKRVRDLNDSIEGLRTKLTELRQDRLEDKTKRVLKSRYIELEDSYEEHRKICEASQMRFSKEIEDYQSNLQRAHAQIQEQQSQISRMENRFQTASNANKSNMQAATPDDQGIEAGGSYYSQSSQPSIRFGGLKKSLRGVDIQAQRYRLATNHKYAGNSSSNSVDNLPSGKISKKSVYVRSKYLAVMSIADLSFQTKTRT